MRNVNVFFIIAQGERNDAGELFIDTFRTNTVPYRYSNKICETKEKRVSQRLDQCVDALYVLVQ